jgi:hypothetical protein
MMRRCEDGGAHLVRQTVSQMAATDLEPKWQLRQLWGDMVVSDSDSAHQTCRLLDTLVHAHAGFLSTSRHDTMLHEP